MAYQKHEQERFHRRYGGPRGVGPVSCGLLEVVPRAPMGATVPPMEAFLFVFLKSRQLDARNAPTDGAVALRGRVTSRCIRRDAQRQPPPFPLHREGVQRHPPPPLRRKGGVTAPLALRHGGPQPS